MLKQLSSSVPVQMVALEPDLRHIGASVANRHDRPRSSSIRRTDDYRPMTPEGQRRAKLMRSTYHLDFPDAVEAHPFNEFTDLGPYDRCISRGPLASMLPTGYNMGTQIFQVPGSVVIVNEMIHETRVIPLDGRPHLGANIRLYMGDSRGRWEGDTLVVETTNLNGKVGLTRNGNTTPTSQDSADR